MRRQVDREVDMSTHSNFCRIVWMSFSKELCHVTRPYCIKSEGAYTTSVRRYAVRSNPPLLAKLIFFFCFHRQCLAVHFLDKEIINVTLHSRHKPRQGSTRRGYAGQSLPINGEAQPRSPVQHANGSLERSFAFPKRSLNSQLISRPMKNWTRASTTLKEHAILRTHVESVNDAAQFQTPLSRSTLQCRSTS